jgi:hypothetical protein
VELSGYPPKVINFGTKLILIIVVLLGIGLTFGSVGFVPDNAIVYVDTNTKEFYSPLSLSQEKVTNLGLKKSTFGQAETLGYQINEDDKQNEYFQQEGRSLTGIFLEKIGILPHLRDRVDSEGNWLY